MVGPRACTGILNRAVRRISRHDRVFSGRRAIVTKYRIYIKLFVGSRLARILHFDKDCATLVQYSECDCGMEFARAASTRISAVRACMRGRWMYVRPIA